MEGRQKTKKALQLKKRQPLRENKQYVHVYNEVMVKLGFMKNNNNNNNNNCFFPINHRQETKKN